MVDLGRNELGEGQNAGLRLRRRERRVVGLDDLVVELADGGDPDQLARYEVRSDPSHQRPKAKPLLRRCASRADAGVQDHEPRDAIRPLDGEAEPDWATPVLDDDRRLVEVELVREASDRGEVEVVRVVLDPHRLVRAPEAEVVGREHARGAGERRDHLPIEVRPRRLSVQEEDGITGPLVDVVHP